MWKKVPCCKAGKLETPLTQLETSCWLLVTSTARDRSESQEQDVILEVGATNSDMYERPGHYFKLHPHRVMSRA